MAMPVPMPVQMPVLVVSVVRVILSVVMEEGSLGSPQKALGERAAVPVVSYRK